MTDKSSNVKHFFSQVPVLDIRIEFDSKKKGVGVSNNGFRPHGGYRGK